MFSIFEKLLKEFWVIRETSEKSFRIMLSLAHDNHNEILVVDESLNVIFSNARFENIMKKLIDNTNPRHIKEFVHENSLESYKEKLLTVIKTQTPCNSTVHLWNKVNTIRGRFLMCNFYRFI